MFFDEKTGQNFFNEISCQPNPFRSEGRSQLLQSNILLAKGFLIKRQVIYASINYPVDKMLFEQKAGQSCFNQTLCWQNAFGTKGRS
jgi:hypothetical protein